MFGLEEEQQSKIQQLEAEIRQLKRDRGNFTISEDIIADGSNEAYKRIGHNAYFGNGFRAGVDFALEQIKEGSND